MKNTYLFFLIPVLLLSACSQETRLHSPSPQKAQVFYLPEYPENYPPLAGWKTVLFSQGTIQTKFLPPQTKEVEFIVKRNNVTPFLAYPITETPFSEESATFFFPAGCIYPYTTRSAWTDGYGAQLAMELLQRFPTEHKRIHSFNWNKLQAFIQKKSQDYKAKDKFFSPWLINKEKLISDILRGKATTYSFQFAETASVPVSTAGLGQLYYRYIPQLPVIAEQDITVLVTVPKEENFSHSEDNMYLTEKGIFSVMGRKNQNGLLVTRQIEEYTVY